MLLLLFIVACIILHSQSQNILTTVSIPSLTTSTTIPSNFVGVSLPFDQIYPSVINSSVFKGYLKNSWVYGNTWASWGISIPVQYPPGFKYDCAYWETMDPNATCTQDIKPLYSTVISPFFQEVANSPHGLSIGFDRESTLFIFTDPSLQTYFQSVFALGFLTELQPIGGSYPSLDIFQQADNYNNGLYSYNITPSTYSSLDFLNELTSLLFVSPSTILGPGVTQNATSDYLDAYASLTTLSKFTVQATPFKTSAELTNSNILNQINYQTYLSTRFTGSFGTITPGVSGVADILISNLKMTSTAGLDGYTNSMLSAIWGLDFLFQSVRFGLSGVKFDVDLSNATLQGPFGAAPDYTPQPLYYAMLMFSILQQQSGTSFISPITVAGSSASIKVHGFLAGDVISLVFLNKDVNTSASGIVFVQSTNTDPMKCIYMTASSLNSKSVTLAGQYFVAGNSTPQGNYTQVSFSNNGTGYSVTLNHAEVALCRMLIPTLTIPSYVTVPPEYLWQSHIQLLLILMIVLLCL